MNTTSDNTKTINTDNKNTGNLDSGAHVTDTKLGVTLSEQAQPARVEKTPGTQAQVKTESTRADLYNSDKPWNLRDQHKRWNLIDTVTWNTTDTGNLKIWDVVADMLTNNLASSPFALYHECKWKTLKLRFEVLGNRYSRGLLCAYFWPTMMQQSTVTPNTDKRRLS